jgi:hypothetical protein
MKVIYMTIFRHVSSNALVIITAQYQPAYKGSLKTVIATNVYNVMAKWIELCVPTLFQKYWCFLLLIPRFV